MKFWIACCVLFLNSFLLMDAKVFIDQAKLGTSLGGWKAKGGQASEYPLSGANYRTYKPEITPTPDGGIFISLRIDHVRGWLSSDDHAVLEITVNRFGKIASAQSSIAIQGRSVSSDLIRGAADAGKSTVAMDRAVQIGTDLVADISQKMLREKIVEAGRVSFPAALRHNYNLLYQAIKHEVAPPVAEAVIQKEPTLLKTEEVKLSEEKKPQALDIKSYATGSQPTLPVQETE